MTHMVKNLEVLNISNNTASGLVVLNDQSLLEKVQHFPFLYNRSINPQNDADYNEWAWQCISKSFNRSYLPQIVNFTPKDLKLRWETLQPLIMTLSKSIHSANIPESLSTIVHAIATQIENPMRNSEITPAQKIIHEHIPMVERLSFDDRRKLEADIMELLIDSELKTKADLQLNSNDLQEIESEYDEFLQVIRLKELFVLSSDTGGNAPDDGNPTDDNDLFTENENSRSPDLVVQEKCETFHNDEQMFMLRTERTATGGSKVSLIALNGDGEPLEDPIAIQSPKDDLLQPMEPPRYIPVTQANLFVRRCRVRVKRVKIDELLPLAVLKREKVWTS